MSPTQRRLIRLHRAAIRALRLARPGHHSILDSSSFLIGSEGLVWMNSLVSLWDYWWN
jgi:hypothetical protein